MGTGHTALSGMSNNPSSVQNERQEKDRVQQQTPKASKGGFSPNPIAQSEATSTCL